MGQVKDHCPCMCPRPEVSAGPARSRSPHCNFIAADGVSDTFSR